MWRLHLVENSHVLSYNWICFCGGGTNPPKPCGHGIQSGRGLDRTGSMERSVFKVSVLQHNSWIENHCYNSLSSLREPHLAASTIYFCRIYFWRIFHKSQSVFSLHSICSVFTWLTFETVAHNRWRFFFFLSLDLCIDIWKLYWDWDAHGLWKVLWVIWCIKLIKDAINRSNMTVCSDVFDRSKTFRFFIFLFKKSLFQKKAVHLQFLLLLF